MDETQETTYLPVFGEELMHELPRDTTNPGMTPKTNSGGTYGECF